MSTSEAITRTDLANILNEVLPVTSKVELEYAGNVSAIHWSSWTAIDDGIVVIDIGWLTNGNFGYYYVKDNTDNFNVGKVTTYTANGTSNTTSFPVLKGHTYQVAAQANVDGSHIYFRYYKFKNPTATCGLADFIVEQGTSGIWTYRKWNSGIAECWGEYDKSVTGVSMTAPFSGYNFDLGTIPFPTGLFNVKPVCTVSGRKNGNYTCVSYSNPSSTGISVEFQSSVSGTATCEAHIHAKGTWK